MLLNQTSNSCCYYDTHTDFQQIFTKQFFINLKHGKQVGHLWKGAQDYDDWIKFSQNSTLGKAINIIDNDDCNIQWQRVGLAQNMHASFYLQQYLDKMYHQKEHSSFRYVPHLEPNRIGLPRILLLGDSISRGIWTETQIMFNEYANIQSAPTNCGGFSQYDEGLKIWLGENYCAWDLIQFNIGMHFHGTDLQPYISGLEKIISQLRKHSPNAKIVFALTTPSPFDSNSTTPVRSECKNYDKFHPKGFVEKINDIAKNVSQKLNVIINDRYSKMLPVLDKYQIPCDVHFVDGGYQLFAKHDWELFSKILGISNVVGYVI